jgi:hypothetical protein
MTLVSYRYTCASCGHDFVAAEAVGYGELVARSAAGSALLHGLDDPVYREVRDMIAALGAYEPLSAPDRGRLTQEVFAVACDPDSDGSEFVIGAMPTCPACGSRSMKSWSPHAAMPDKAIPPLTHVRWSRLSSEGKESLLKARLRAHPLLESIGY